MTLLQGPPFKNDDLVENRYRILERIKVSAGMSGVY